MRPPMNFPLSGKAPGGGGAPSLPDSLFGEGDEGDWWDRNSARMFQEAAESTAVTTDEDRIGSIRGGFANTQLTAATTFRPYYEVVGGDPRLDFRNAQRLASASGVFNFTSPTLIWHGLYPATGAAHVMFDWTGAANRYYSRLLTGPARVQYRTDAQGTITSADITGNVVGNQKTTVVHRASDGKWFMYNSTRTGELTVGLAAPTITFPETAILHLGGLPSGTSFMNTDTYFWMVISRALTDTEIGNLATYLDETYP